MQTKPRNRTIDVAKGMSILFVVFSHSWIVLHEKAALYLIIFSFQAPFFLFAAGIFIKERSTFPQLLTAKADSLLKPYFVVLTALSIGKLIFQPDEAADYFGGMLYANGEVISWVPMWFLPHLFLGFVFCWLLIRLARHFNLSLWLFIPLLWLSGVWVLDKFWELPLAQLGGPATLFGGTVLPGLPFSADLLLLSSAFLLTGFALKERVKVIRFNALGFFVAVVVFATCHTLFNYSIDLNLRRYDHLAVSTLQIVSGAYALINAAAWLSTSRVQWPAKLLGYAGSASLFILIFHMVVQVRVFDIIELAMPDHPYLNGVLSYLVALAVPALLFEIVRRIPWLAMVMLPLSSSAQPRSPKVIEAREASAR